MVFIWFSRFEESLMPLRWHRWLMMVDKQATGQWLDIVNGDQQLWETMGNQHILGDHFGTTPLSPLIPFL